MDDTNAAPLRWLDVLETGVPALDDEHRRLIDQCNALNTAMDHGAEWEHVVAVVRELAEHCAEHFRAEELLLEKTDFPRRRLHEAQHRRIEAQFRELVTFLAGVDGSKPEHRNAARSTRDTLIDVLFRHDLDYKSHLQHHSGR